MQPLVTFGIVNCNRLHYLKSCFESLVFCTDDYPNREFIVVDNASIETGTAEYLTKLESAGVKVVRNAVRDPANEFAKGLNTIISLAQGEILFPLQGDMQFVIRGKWLQKYVDLVMSNDSVGCVLLDAQRLVTHKRHEGKMSEFVTEDEFKFVIDDDRPQVSGAADVMYPSSVIKMMGKWSEKNANHEGTLDSETDMLQRVARLLEKSKMDVRCYVPVIPPAITIYTDARGTNARVRGNRLYGDYWPPKADFRYYEIFEYDDVINAFAGRKLPVSIEEIANPIGWNRMVDETGSWKKNPIRPETAGPSDYIELGGVDLKKADPKHITDWFMS